jgi:hypothetical protein
MKLERSRASFHLRVGLHVGLRVGLHVLPLPLRIAPHNGILLFVTGGVLFIFKMDKG